MRDLKQDLQWLTHCKRRDLSDKYLRENGAITRECYQTYAPEWQYGITFVESDIALEWLKRAIEAEKFSCKEE